MDEVSGRKRINYTHASGGAVYGIGMFGALVYFLSHATSLWLGIHGIFQALFWPAYLVYYAFQALLK